ncbi:M16 family metallopeptidase [Paraferrimonas haliotis]|uniref:Peptidase M16 n=1 Tax=Paraferrimonas haliotis TaxID=2013866 RepID=A0AA37TMA3_9GAMM|nr:pitrilysin family protein [Paraferrimonas haliotis]GLS82095.1 peptidase M16 [Paraferrimonas haliotis]
MKSIVAILASALVVMSGCASQDTNPPSNLQSTASTSKGFSLPAYQQTRLDNGLTVYLMPDAEVPLVNVKAVIRAGAVNDTNPGLADMTAASLSFGAGERSKQDIEQAVDFVGASIDAYAGLEGTVVESSFLKQNDALILPIIADMVIDPSFDAQEFEKAKNRKKAALQQAKESPRAVINQYFMASMYGQHPYGNAIAGEVNRIDDINVSLLRAFHQGFYQPQNSAIVVTGDFDSNTMLAQITQLFGSWKNEADINQPELSGGLKTLNSNQVLLVDKPDARETTFLIGGVGVAKDNPDSVGLSVINTVLGGRFTSWLNDELRVNSGLTYGARSAFVSNGESGVFRISTFTATATTKEAIDLALSTYQRLWSKGLDQATLDSAKAYVKGQFPPRYETAAQRGAFLANMYLYGYDEGYINDFEAKVNALTLENANQLIAKYFPKDNYQFVLIGKADDIRDLAKSYGEVTEVSIATSGFAR